LERATFADCANFLGASFGARSRFGPIGVVRDLDISGSKIDRLGHLRFCAKFIRAQGIELSAGVSVEICWAEVDLSRAQFLDLSRLMN
jgi:hypothetical protein